MRRLTKVLTGLVWGSVLTGGAAFSSTGTEPELLITETSAQSVLLDDFVTALQAFGEGKSAKAESRAGVRLWMEGLLERGVDPEFVKARLGNLPAAKGDFFAKFKQLKVEQVVSKKTRADGAEAQPVALHAFRLDVVDDYDGFKNDDVYLYFITTHDDLLWGKVTDIYKGMNANNSAFLSPEDRAIFGPKGEKLAPSKHLIVDIGVIESDGDDIKELQKLSDAIVDLAVVALAVYNPAAGVAAASARAETKNLLRMVIEMNSDDRLAADSVYFDESNISERFEGDNTISEFIRRYRSESDWSSFDYKLRFRFLR